MAAPLAFVVGVLAAGSLTASGALDTALAPRFVHAYPPDPVPVERPKVGPPPNPPAARNMVTYGRYDSLAALAKVLAPGTLLRAGRVWWLERPVQLDGGSRTVLSGPGTLALAPGAYLEVGTGGSLVMSGLRLVGAGRDGRSLTRPVPGRGFVLDAGGRLLLRRDTLEDLGYLGNLAYGVSFLDPEPGSAVLGSAIRGGYMGVYATGARGLVLRGNRIGPSDVYGIDVYGRSRAVSVTGNTVTGAGTHGIVLAGGVRQATVAGNRVRLAGDHGILLYNGADGNHVLHNRLTGCFDGIVVTDASANVVAGNVVRATARFGLRLSAGSSRNIVVANTFVRALVGVYVYGGANRNLILANTFAGDQEDVRVRGRVAGNRIRPIPPLGEIGGS